MSEVEIASRPIAGAIGRITEMHGSYYHRHWGFGLFFEARVATELVEFLGRFDPRRDGFWTASLAGRIEGSIAIDAQRSDADGAHLRWFILSDALRGQGVGTRLIESAIECCRDRGYGNIYLWTFEGLTAARHLYEKAGFSLAEEFRGSQWGSEVTEQRFELRLDQARAGGHR